MLPPSIQMVRGNLRGLVGRLTHQSSTSILPTPDRCIRTGVRIPFLRRGSCPPFSAPVWAPDRSGVPLDQRGRIDRSNAPSRPDGPRPAFSSVSPVFLCGSRSKFKPFSEGYRERATIVSVCAEEAPPGPLLHESQCSRSSVGFDRGFGHSGESFRPGWWALLEGVRAQNLKSFDASTSRTHTCFSALIHHIQPTPWHVPSRPLASPREERHPASSWPPRQLASPHPQPAE